MKKQRNNSNITNNNSNSFTYFNGNKCFCKYKKMQLLKEPRM